MEHEKIEKIIYTDGHDVVVTDSALKVKHTSYRLNGIIRYGLSIVEPKRLPAVILLIAGLLLAFAGWIKLFDVAPYYINGYIITMNAILLWVGLLCVVAGIVVLAILKKRYAVRISTAEGEKDAVVSNKREFINQIVTAMNEAFHAFTRPTPDTYVAFKE